MMKSTSQEDDQLDVCYFDHGEWGHFISRSFFQRAENYPLLLYLLRQEICYPVDLIVDDNCE
jgi:hypothetical protein